MQLVYHVSCKFDFYSDGEMKMNQLMAMTAEITMSSLDFLEIINSERIRAGESAHEPRKFLSKVQDELDLGDTGKKFRLNNNRTESAYYDLNVEQMMLVGMRESKSVRKSVLTKLKEIDRPSLPDFNDPIAAARAWADAKEYALITERKLAIAAPKVAFVDRYVERKTLQTATQVANTLGLPSAIALNRELDRIGGVYDKRVKRGRAFCSDWLEGGFGEVKQGELGFSSALFTPAGIERLAEILKN